MICIYAPMPEGPSIVILKEAVRSFNHQKILKAAGRAPIDLHRLENQVIRSIKSFGKQLIISFDGFFIRIHLLMFGTYLVNEKKSTPLKLGLTFKKTELNFYTCSVVLHEGKADQFYDWTADIMNNKWDEKKALTKLKAFSETLICDVLMDQDIFAGLGNIIKNEILFNSYIHPASKTGKIPATRKKILLQEAVRYSFDFLKWKKEGTLKKHWLAYAKKKCPRCNIPFNKEYLGTAKRRSFFCNNCQKCYG